MAYVANLIKWYAAQRSGEGRVGLERIRAGTLALGDWLKGQNYVGVDVAVGNPPKQLSTVLGFSLTGWVNLHTASGEPQFLREAEQCLERLLAMQTPEGAWLFPYRFRNNRPDFPYACESFMTLRALLHYCEHVEPDQQVARSIQRGIHFLVENIGCEAGIFWYSAADRITVPNVSSLAANVFARASRVLNNHRYLEQAKVLADYCIDQQTEEGAYPYFGGGDMVYVPYHALEIWELQEANEVIHSEKITDSTNRGVDYLTNYFRTRGYLSRSTEQGFRHTYLFKTPLWGARAYLVKKDPANSLKHFAHAVSLFQFPRKPCYFYLLHRTRLSGFSIDFPILRSTFIRYNASCFEVGSRLLLKAPGERMC